MTAPDMTPQGLSDAIDELVADLPRQKERVSESWQKVLTLQALSIILGGNWYEGANSVEFTDACSAASDAVSAAVRILLTERPALYQAVYTAFDLPNGAKAAAERTAFADSPLGQTLLVPALFLHEDEAAGDVA